MALPASQQFSLAVAQAKTLVVTMDANPPGGVSTWDMRFRLRRRGVAVVTKETGDGVTTTDETAGVWEILIDAADTFTPAAGQDPAVELLKPGLYDWSFWNTAAGEENPVAWGTCQVYRTAETG